MSNPILTRSSLWFCFKQAVRQSSTVTSMRRFSTSVAKTTSVVSGPSQAGDDDLDVLHVGAYEMNRSSDRGRVGIAESQGVLLTHEPGCDLGHVLGKVGYSAFPGTAKGKNSIGSKQRTLAELFSADCIKHESPFHFQRTADYILSDGGAKISRRPDWL